MDKNMTIFKEIQVEEKEGEGKRIRTDAREMEEREESFEIKEN